jgi:hypothetical protein
MMCASQVALWTINDSEITTLNKWLRSKYDLFYKLLLNYRTSPCRGHKLPNISFLYAASSTGLSPSCSKVFEGYPALVKARNKKISMAQWFQIRIWFDMTLSMMNLKEKRKKKSNILARYYHTNTIVVDWTTDKTLAEENVERIQAAFFNQSWSDTKLVLDKGLCLGYMNETLWNKLSNKTKLSDISSFRCLLNLPGSSAGGYSQNLNYL